MRKTLSLLSMMLLGAALMTGCAGPERKFGRGFSNALEPIRLGEVRRSIEQTALFDGPDAGYSTGWMRGINRTFARTGIGIYEMVTAPIPNGKRGYDPICTDYLAPGPVSPDSYAPNLVEDSTVATDTNLGFAGGDVAPMVPGSRFRIFDTH